MCRNLNILVGRMKVKSLLFIVINIGSTAIGGPRPLRAKIASGLYPGHLPASFYDPVSLCIHLPHRPLCIASCHCWDILPASFPWGFVTVFFFMGWALVSLMPKSQPWGPWYPFFSGSSPLTCLAWEALPVAYATGSTALGIIRPHKPHHYAKVWMPSGRSLCS